MKVKVSSQEYLVTVKPVLCSPNAGSPEKLAWCRRLAGCDTVPLSSKFIRTIAKGKKEGGGRGEVQNAFEVAWCASGDTTVV